MATVRISGTTTHNIHKKEWLGAPGIDTSNHIERSLDLPEIVYQRIEEGIGQGHFQGMFHLDDGRHIEWFLDRGARPVEPRRTGVSVGTGEGI